MSGKVPFSETKAELRVAYEKYGGALPGRPAGIEDKHWEFILECCAGDPGRRPTVGEVKVRLEELRGK